GQYRQPGGMWHSELLGMAGPPCSPSRRTAGGVNFSPAVESPPPEVRSPMPLFGAHMSVAGGCHNAVALARSHGCTALQIFTKNANQWAAKPLAGEDVRSFRDALRGSGV